MPQVVVTAGARRGLERCRRFLAEKNPVAAGRAAVAIRSALRRLEDQPEIGRTADDPDGLRELLISFGASGYVALYSYERATDTVVILAFRHQKEAGY